MENNTLLCLAVAEELEQVIQSAVPECEKINKYGGVLFTLKLDEKEGQFCGVFIYKQHVQLSFSRGAFLDDPKQILSGSGKLRRYINFKNNKNIYDRELSKLLIQAAEL